MCGFVGIIESPGKAVDPYQLRTMTRLLTHRGPDDEGYLLLAPAEGRVAWWEAEQSPPMEEGPFSMGLGHRRLSILDLSPRGRQPMANEDGSLWLVYNGEIYNYMELAEELRALGHEFRSETDSEVVLHAYEEWGEACVERFNGMWAFALMDLPRQRLICARDRFGVKPFYYFHDAERFLFASEIKALLHHYAVPVEPNSTSIFHYLAYGYGFVDVGTETFFKGIHQLPPGTVMVLEGGHVQQRTFWSLEPRGEIRYASDAEYVEAFRELFFDAVRLRLRSDVPVGVCLSGGLDSSSIVGAVHALDGQEPITTFSSCFDDQRYDEREYIEPTVNALGLKAHYIFPPDQFLFELLPRVIWHQDEPFANYNIYAQWHLMEYARRHGFKVLLNGHGGDETLAGYYPHFSAFFADLLCRGQWGILGREMRSYATVHGRSSWKALQRALHLVAGSRLPAAVKTHLRRLVQRPTAASCLHPEFARQRYPRLEVERRFKGCLDNQLLEGLRVSPLPSWLHFEDRNSMAFGIETRLPFLDYRLVEHLFSYPDDQKIRKGMTKYVLREAMRGCLPEAVRLRASKMGFTTPAERWFQESLRHPVRELLTSRRFQERGYLDPAAVLTAFDAHCRGERLIYKIITSWINLEIWFRTFIDGESPANGSTAITMSPGLMEQGEST